MAFQNIQLRPGILRETTSYANEGGWFDGDMVRFRYGLPEKIGGWTKASSDAFQGACRSLHNWLSVGGSDYLGMGTNLKFYIEEGNTFYDITPIRRTVALTAAALSTVNTSTTITVTDGTHGALENDFVTFTGLSAVNGIGAGYLNKEHQIISVSDSNVYTITAGAAATSTGAGSSGDAFTAAYQINTGPNSTTGGNGWGAGLWGGIVTGAWATKTAKSMDDVTTDGVTAPGLKSIWVATTKRTAKSLLAQTDWYVTRLAEKTTAISSKVSTYRDKVRAACDKIETAINACSDVAALEAMFVVPVDSDGKATSNAPMHDWPIDE